MPRPNADLEVAPPSRSVLLRATGNHDGEALPCDPTHNRWRVVVAQPPTAVITGNVRVAVGCIDPERPGEQRLGRVGTVVLGTGGAVSGDMPPAEGAYVGASIDGWSGSGEVQVILETWREGP